MPARKTSSALAVTEYADASPATLRDKFAALEAEALRSWRQYAADLAAGSRAPNPEEVLRIGAILRINNPASALEADAGAIAEDRRLADRVDRQRRESAALLEPWGGEVSRLRDEIADLKKRAAELEQKARSAASGCYWEGPRSRLRLQNPRIFTREAR
jgi:hypothetical protein